MRVNGPRDTSATLEERSWRWSRITTTRLIAYSLLLFVLVAILLAHWPGRLDGDSMATIRAVRSGAINDQRSPVLTWIWRQAYRVTQVGPGVVFLVQTTTLTAGLYLLLRSAFGRIAAATLAALILLAPATFGFVGLVGRDAWFVSSCMLEAGLVVAALRWTGRRRDAALVGGFLAAGISVAARQNGFTAVLPITVALAVPALATWREHMPAVAAEWVGRWPRTAAFACGAMVTAAFVLASTLGGAIVRDRHAYPQVYTQLYDLGYLTLAENERLMPRLSREVLPVQTPANMPGRWLPSTSIFMRWDPKQNFAPGSGSRPFTPDEAAALGRSWRRALMDHPLEYLNGRFGLWKAQLGIGYAPWYAMVLTNAANPWGYNGPAFPAASKLATRYATHWGASRGSLTGGPLQHVWMYAVCCLVAVSLLLRRFSPPVRAVGALATAAMGLQVGLFFLAPSAQLRYELLTAYAALVVICVGARLAIAALVAHDLGRLSRRRRR